MLRELWIRPKIMEKTYISKQKFLMGSPRKLRLVTALIKKLSPVDAVERLPFVGKRAAGDLLKVVKSAMANARQQGASDTDLVFKEIQVNQGPNLKRGRAASRGRWHPYVKKMSHITVVLTEKGSSKNAKSVKAEKVSSEKVTDVKPVEKSVKKTVKKVTKKNVTKS